MTSSAGWLARWKSRANRTTPNPRFPGLLLAFGIAEFVVNDWPWLRAIVLLFGCAILMIASADFVRLYRVGIPSVRRNVEAVPQQGLPTVIEVHVDFPDARRASHYPLNRDVLVDMGLPATFESTGVAGGEVLYDAEGSSVTFTESRIPRYRGVHRLTSVDVKWMSPWRFWSRIRREARVDDVLVLPDVTTWRRDVGMLQQTLLHEGRHVKRTVGGDADFSHIAEYTIDDDPRYVNWAATARRQRLMKNVLQPERGQTILIAVDASRYMGVVLPDGKTRLDYALECACALAQAALQAGDTVGVMAFFSDVILQLPVDKGRGHWNSIVHAMAGIEAKPVHGGYHALLNAVRRNYRRRSLLVILSELEGVSADTNFVGTMTALKRHHSTLLASVTDVHVLRQFHCAPKSEKDMAELAAAEWMVQQREQSLQQLQRQGIEVVQAPPNNLAVDVVRNYLLRKQRYRL